MTAARVTLAVLALFLASAGCAARAPVETASPPSAEPAASPWLEHSGEGFRIPLHRDWPTMHGEFLPPGMQLHVTADGVGFPLLDEDGQPVQVGFAVEARDGPYDDTSALAQEVHAEIQGDSAIERVERYLRKDTHACMGEREAHMLLLEFDKAGTDRKSVYLRSVVRGDDGRGWIASGWIVAGRGSSLPTADGPFAESLYSVLVGFCPDLD